MTPELARACYQCTPPFHGDTCEVRNLSPDRLWRCYKVAVSLVVRTSTDDVVRTFADWHHHDGFITGSNEITVADWTAWLESPESLMQAWKAEDWCHQTVYPPDMAWCLRFLRWEEFGETPLVEHSNACSLDLSGDPNLVKEFADTVRELHQVELGIKASCEWFIESGHTDISPEHLERYTGLEPLR